MNLAQIEDLGNVSSVRQLTDKVADLKRSLTQVSIGEGHSAELGANQVYKTTSLLCQNQSSSLSFTDLT